MPVTGDENVRWLSAIGRSLAYLCLEKAQAAGSLPSVLAKVDFLKGLGLSEADASYAAGSNPELVRVMRSKQRGGKRGRKK